MTEAEWVASEDPSMFAYGIDATDRKWRLVLCVCSRRLWKQMEDDRSRCAIEQSERFADGLISEAEMVVAGEAAQKAWRESHNKHGDSPQLAAAAAAAYTSQQQIHNNDRSNAMGAVREAFTKSARIRTEKQAQVETIRDIIGNPFHPVVFSTDWRIDTVVSLARRMYESRDFGAMPILADALQDAGCDNGYILDHCRGPGPHVRGCWVVDLVLGKE